mmetsp:Transcript_17457/g.52452  ORF Transcript_17457/g.52452 Transcript_17457/m.52452 type:complete len:232 (+) Transcript_17457:1397-2092(+)
MLKCRRPVGRSVPCHAAQSASSGADAHTLCPQLVPVHHAGVAAGVLHGHTASGSDACSTDGTSAASCRHFGVTACRPGSRLSDWKWHATSRRTKSCPVHCISGTCCPVVTADIQRRTFFVSWFDNCLCDGRPGPEQLQLGGLVLHSPGSLSEVRLGDVGPDQRQWFCARHCGCCSDWLPFGQHRWQLGAGSVCAQHPVAHSRCCGVYIIGKERPHQSGCCRQPPFCMGGAP